MDSEDFLLKIWGLLPDGQFGEFRYIRDGKVEQGWVSVEPHGFRRYGFTPVDDRWDTYFGVLPRLRQSGRAEDVVDVSRVLWSDFDAKHFGSKAEARHRINAITPAPHLAVDSGGGYHVYWLLDKEVPWASAHAVMKGIETSFGADHCSDKPRVLRVPGTLNHKYSPPAEVKVVVWDDLAPLYSISDFDPYLQDPVSLPRKIAIAPWNGVLPVSVSEDLRYDPGKGRRSEHLMSVIVRLMLAGLPDDQVQRFIEQSAAGAAKQDEKGRYWPHYIEREIRHAREFVQR